MTTSVQPLTAGLTQAATVAPPLPTIQAASTSSTSIALNTKPVAVGDIFVSGNKDGQQIDIGDLSLSVTKQGIVIDLGEGKHMAIKQLKDGRIAILDSNAKGEITVKLQEGTTAVKVPTGNKKFASLNVDVQNGELQSFSIATGSAAINAKLNTSADSFDYATGKTDKPIKNQLEIDENKNLLLKSSANNNSESWSPNKTAAVDGIMDLAAGFGGFASALVGMVTQLAFSPTGRPIANIYQPASSAST